VSEGGRVLPTPAANKPLRAASRVGYAMRVEGRKWMFVLGWEEEDRVGVRCRGGTLSPSNSLYFFTILSNLRFITPRPPSSSSSAVRAGKAQAMAVKTSSQVLKGTRQKSLQWDAVKHPRPNVQEAPQRISPDFAAISNCSCNATSSPLPWSRMPCAMRHVHVTAIQCAQGDVTYARVSLDVDEVDGLYAEHLREDSVA
jgi:hypothetical protein